jgi:Tfp pilus assembly protein PilX
MKPPSHLRPAQTGSTLIISLIMLVLMTLFVLSAINSSTVNLRISANTQAADEAHAAAQRAVEAHISAIGNFYPTPTGLASTSMSVNNDATGNYTVTVATPVCRRAAKQIPARTVDCANGEAQGIFCVDTLWEVSATATNASTGVSQTVVQGVSISFAPDSVPSNCN